MHWQLEEREMELSKHNDEFEPNNLPQTLTREITIWYGIGGWQSGCIGTYDFDFKGNEEKIVLGKQIITLEIGKQGDLKEKVLDSLNAEKQKILAENHERLERIQNKIDNLLAIEYKPEEA